MAGTRSSPAFGAMKMPPGRRSVIFRRAIPIPSGITKISRRSFGDNSSTGNAPGEHVRVQPLLDWTEVDIWRYIQREKIPIPAFTLRGMESVSAR